jgi:putative ABC transport system substrate-binding protein
MNRRRFLAFGITLAAARAASAQAQRPRIAWVSPASRDLGAAVFTPFLEGMAALGYAPGRNIDVLECWGSNSREELERRVTEAAAMRPALYVSQGLALATVRKLPGATPVVFGISGDPVEAGVAKSIARPGGQFTGVSFLAYTLVGKRVELLHQVVPSVRRLAVLSNSEHRGDAKELAATREAAAGFGMQVTHFPATNAAEVAAALGGIARAKADGLVVHPDGLMVQQRGTIARAALEQRIPMVSGWATLAEAGGLLTYGPVLAESYRRLSYFVDRILKGANPAELPIEMPSIFELVVNVRTARALGIALPQAFLVRADRVIE